MRSRAVHILLLAALLLQGGLLCGQNHVRDAMRRARLQHEALAAKNMDRQRAGIITGGYLAYTVENGDTTYYDTIDPVWVFAKSPVGKKKDWRKYYRLVYNFARVYPYAQAAGHLDHVADSTIQAEKMGRLKKDKYVAGIQKDLFKDFEGALRGMTISRSMSLRRRAPWEMVMPRRAPSKSLKRSFWMPATGRAARPPTTSSRSTRAASPPASGTASPSSSTTPSRPPMTPMAPTRTPRSSSRSGTTALSPPSTTPFSSRPRPKFTFPTNTNRFLRFARNDSGVIPSEAPCHSERSEGI